MQALGSEFADLLAKGFGSSILLLQQSFVLLYHFVLPIAPPTILIQSRQQCGEVVLFESAAPYVYVSCAVQ